MCSNLIGKEEEEEELNKSKDNKEY